jgi:hypothetical protein
MAWTDERLDDLAARMDAGFARIDRELREVRTEMRELRAELKGDVDSLRAELKGDIDSLRSVMVRFAIAMMVCMAGVIATLIGAIVTGAISG